MPNFRQVFARRWMKVISTTLVVCVMVIAGLTMMTHLKLLVRTFVVTSGSMEPAIPRGALILTLPRSTYAVGDIVTFRLPTQKVPITHRLVRSEQVDGQTLYETRGDANNAVDADLITKEVIIGRYQFYLPWIGYLIDFVRRPAGLVLFVIIPATLIIYREINNIQREWKKMRRQNRRPAVTFPVTVSADTIIQPAPTTVQRNGKKRRVRTQPRDRTEPKPQISRHPPGR